MATIGDVAKLAGLSRATVSRVINNHPYVTEEKKKLVVDAMEQLGYVPNSIAQQLRRQTVTTVAVIVPRISNPFFSLLVEAMEREAARQGFQLIVCQTQMDKHRELEYLGWLRKKQIGGIIFASTENRWEEIKDYASFGPVVFCNEYPDHTDVPIIGLDQFEGGYLGTRHLIEKGHRRIAYCGGSDSVTNIRERKKGFDHALQEENLFFDEQWSFSGVYDSFDGQRVFREIMKLSPRPTAVFTGSDQVAAGMIKEARSQGVRVPDAFAVIGFDDQPIAELMDPTITTVYQPVEEMGRRTMELMIRIISEGHPSEQASAGLSLRVVEREST
ncbi:MAG TPA: LacI family DNA-binding transcriptional regulator [Bacillales bacterium]|nr:LacI family DNA-binding transcriptional regulator [Bacillales bacterium]